MTEKIIVLKEFNFYWLINLYCDKFEVVGDVLFYTITTYYTSYQLIISLGDFSQNTL